MNLGGVRVGTVLGIPVRIDWSVLAIFVLVSWSLSAAIFPELASGYPAAVYWTAGIGTAVLFLGALLAHELSHCVVARRRGIEVRDITLWLFGGVSTIEGEAHAPRDEMMLALAGPATSMAIGIASAFVALVLAAVSAPVLLIGAALWFAAINAVLAVFNLAPAAPLDGGRVLHAWLWHRNGDRTRAGVTAARAGRVFGWLLITIGVAEFLLVDTIGGLWLAILGSFLIAAARAEEMQNQLVHDLGGTRVRDVMTPSPVTVPEDASVETVLEAFVLRHHCSAFPVVGRDGSLRGLVTLSRLRTVPPVRRPSTPVRELAWPLDAVTTARPDEALIDVLQRVEGGDNRVLVLDAGRLVGIVTPTDVSRAVQIGSVAHAA
jgi:Zn-dependent protease/CBS domain-containing protein